MTLKELPAPAMGAEERSDEVPTAGAGAPAARRDPEVAAKPKRRQFTAERFERLIEPFARPDRGLSPSEASLGEETRARLRAMGYLSE